MQKIFTLCFFAMIFFSLQTVAQTSTEEVLFDNYISASDNDLANWFSGGNGLTQITTSGIIGGCLTTPDSINWGNDNANYCFKYVAGLSTPTTTSFCFKYDTALISLPSYARCATIWLSPGADWNHYIVASVSHQKRIEILSYSWTNNPGPLLTLVHGNWYQLLLNTNLGSADSVYIHTEVNDLGTTGLNFPVLVAQSNGALVDNIFSTDTAIQVGISGSHKGGALYLDNFNYSGQKSSDSCAFSIPNAVNNFSAEENFIFSYNDNLIQLSNHFPSMNIEIINLEGETISSENVNENFSFNTSFLPSGIYFLKAETAKENFVRKFVVLR